MNEFSDFKGAFERYKQDKLGWHIGYLKEGYCCLRVRQGLNELVEYIRWHNENYENWRFYALLRMDDLCLYLFCRCSPTLPPFEKKELKLEGVVVDVYASGSKMKIPQRTAWKDVTAYVNGEVITKHTIEDTSLLPNALL